MEVEKFGGIIALGFVANELLGTEARMEVFCAIVS